MTLVLPLVSTGNVPQLTVDLILHSFDDDFHFVEDLNSKYLHPFVGPLDHTFDSNNDTSNNNSPSLYSSSLTDIKNQRPKLYSSALELFSNKDRSVYILQQRTPIIQGYINNFIIEVLSPLINRLKIRKLSILDSYGVFDTNIVTSFRMNNSNNNDTNNNHYLTSAISNTISTNTATNISIGTCNVNSINDITSNFQQSLNLKFDSNSNLHYTSQFFKFNLSDPIQEISTNQTIFKIVYHLLNNLNSSLSEIKYFTMLVHEGDNSMDAKYFVRSCLPMIINEKYSVSRDSQFKIPISWMGVYGMTDIPSTIEEGIYI